MKEIIAIIIFLGLIVGGAVWLPDLFRKQEESNDTRPPITGLKENEALNKTFGDAQPEAAAQEAETPAEDIAKASDPALLTVKVLNGGAPSGSAGKAASTLKTAGFKLAAATDATGSYTGITVFYLAGNPDHQADAEAVKTALIKIYPSVKIQETTDPKKEEGSASVVVVLGK